ncbi:hypothetical protein ACFPER_12075 [Agromyces aurantiacus]|uniref:Apea-like HEPN domain-containing protein n=1 Tax=Agromyces aurantiacus TaxID=165814 RepID=A0ABV9R6E4_9MICO|nr:hypothetical protein [Agromyces aurantiacus]MBM7504218.1 hypothetical protein [Agromyces aurantiacus]
MHSESGPETTPEQEEAHAAWIERLARALTFGEPIREMSADVVAQLEAHVAAKKPARAREEIGAPLGQFLLEFTQLDEAISVVLATLLNRHEPDKVIRVVRQMTTSQKLDAMEGAFPDTWEDGRDIIRRIRELNTYRNVVAHGTFTTFRVERDQLLVGQWFAIWRRGKQHWVHTSAGELDHRRWEVNFAAAVLYTLVLVLIEPEASLEDVDLFRVVGVAIATMPPADHAKDNPLRAVFMFDWFTPTKAYMDALDSGASDLGRPSPSEGIRQELRKRGRTPR